MQPSKSCLLLILLYFQDAASKRRYAIGYEKISCDQAVNMCRKKSMELASIRNEQENNDIYKFLSQHEHQGGFFTSGKILSYADGWKWLDGKPIEYFNWNTGEPNGYDEKRCIQIFIRDKKLVWNDNRSSYPDYYLCESRDDENTSISSSVNWQKSEDKYHFSQEKVTFFEAIQYCENLSMQLATIENAEENSDIQSSMLVEGDGFWISANRRYGSNIWRWLTGNKVEYFNWVEDKADNDRTAGNCMTISRKKQIAKWKEAPCEQKHFVICQKPTTKLEIEFGENEIAADNSKKPSHQSNFRKILLDVKTSDFFLRLNVDRK